MKLLLIALTISAFSVSDLREIYESQEEDKVMSSLKQLESKKSLSKDEECYKAVFTCLKAKFVTNPYTKITSFNTGYALLEKVIKDSPNNVEYRFHRYMIETNAPSWLFDELHTEEDKRYIFHKKRS